MTFPHVRLVPSAALFLALSTAPASFSQAAAASPTPDSPIELASTLPSELPDAPSFTLIQQQPQQAPSTSQQPPQNETPEQKQAREQREEAQRQVEAEEKQRIGGIIPNFNVQMGGPFVPLSVAQKWSLSWHTIIDPYTFGLALVIGGGLGEAEDDHQGYHWGTAGYFRRSGASYLDNVDGNLIGNFLLPVILKQDPRYFRKGTGSLKSRIIYSALTTFICKGNNGKTQFNFSNVAGNFLSGTLSNVYYPHDERGVGLTINNAITVTLEGMLGAQLLEFSPDVTAKIKHHRQVVKDRKAAAAAAAAAAKGVPPPEPQHP